MKEIKNTNSFFKDFSWYFLGSFIPLLIGFIKTPVFTRHFNKVEYGSLGLVTITFTFFGMFLFSWIGSCLWRYYNKYESDNSLKTLYSNLFFLYISAFVLLLILSVFWYTSTSQYLIKQLIFYSFFQLFLNQLLLLYMVVVRLSSKAKFYTIFQSVKAIISVVIALVLVFYFKNGIVALISSLAIVDTFAVIFLMFYNPVKVKVNLKLISKSKLAELLVYGSVGLILNISLLVITYSDRYIIAWFNNIEDVGIYDQVYKISQLSVVALVTIFFNTINPYLLKELEINFDNSTKLIQKYIKAFVIFGLPVIFYLSLFSKDISTILLGKEFRVGYAMMPFIFMSAYLHGISNFYELRLKFSHKLKKLGIIALGVAVLNIILTITFVSLYGYQWAAYTTLITYLILVIILHFMDREIIILSKKNKILLIKIIIVLVLQGLFFIMVNTQFNMNIFSKLTIGFLYALMYIVLFKKSLSLTKIPIN